jgi:hypothetical protein
MCAIGVRGRAVATLSCSNARKAANLARMRRLRLQLTLAYCLWQLLACADGNESDDGTSYHPKIGGPIVEFPWRRARPTADQPSTGQSAVADAGVPPPPAVMVSPAGAGGSTGPETMNGGVAAGGIGATGGIGGVAGGVGGPGGGTTGALGGFAGGSAGGSAQAPAVCDAAAPPAATDAGAADAGTGDAADPGCAADAAVEAAAVAPDPAP